MFSSGSHVLYLQKNIQLSGNTDLSKVANLDFSFYVESLYNLNVNTSKHYGKALALPADARVIPPITFTHGCREEATALLQL